jgi:hypothetical protein
MVKELTKKQKEDIATKYSPLLVLYPEIEAGSQRSAHYNPGHRAGHPPLDQDYHPRDLKIALDNASLPGIRARIRKPSPADVREAMTSNTVKNIDILPGTKPSEADKFWHFYATIEDKDNRYPRKAYARIIPGSRRYADYLIIQYWLAYFFDDWANVHEMDWEMVSVVIKKTEIEERPVACIYRAHAGGFRAPWKDVEKADGSGKRIKNGIHPIAYVANGSHASYFHDDPSHSAAASIVGPRLSRLASSFPWIRNTFSDYVPSFADGSKHFTEVEVMPEPNEKGVWEEEEWWWLNFTGRWGSKGKVSWTDKLTLPLEEDGPPGLSKQGPCWDDPFAWIDDKCFSLEEDSWLLKVAKRRNKSR